MVCAKPFYFKGLLLPCGHCILCRIKHASEWAYRLTCELNYWEDCVFVTLTYDEEHCPLSLKKEDLQKFIKRLRKRLDNRKIKYFACGEYGDRFGRPHYHLLLYGVSLADRLFIEESWKFGFITISNVKKERINYVARYCLKKYSKKENDEIYEGLEKPFQLCSKGLGLQFALDNAFQLQDNLGDKFNGRNISLPRYYCKRLNIDSDILLNVSKLKREFLIKEHNLKSVHTVDSSSEKFCSNGYYLYRLSVDPAAKEIAAYKKYAEQMAKNLEKKKGRF